MIMHLVSDNEKTVFQSLLSEVQAADGDIRFERLLIDPEMAAEMLERISPENRRGFKEDVVKEYTEAMEKGAWLDNGMPIIFDQEGNLIDGVQRLHAVIRANVTIISSVAFNIPGDALHTIDQHRRRTYSGVLETREVLNAGTLIRLMTNLIRIENGELGIESYPIGWGRFERVRKSNPLLTEAVNMASSATQRGSALLTNPRTALTFMALAAGHREEIELFLRALKEDGVVEADSPALILKNQLITRRADVEHRSDDYSDTTQLALGILAFNDFLKGEKASRPYRWVPKYKKPGGETADPSVKAELRELAPENLGLPQMDGYPGLENGKIEKGGKEILRLSPEMEERLTRGAKRDTSNSKTVMVTVTPEMAYQWIERFNEGNRRPQEGHISMMARDIQNGRWMINAQPICFTGDPLSYDYSDEPVRKEGDMRLLNGQHRLKACIAADTPIEVPIASYIPEEAFVTYDLQTKKSQSGMIGKEGYKVDARIAAAAARLQWRVDNGMDPTKRGQNPTESEIMETLDRHPELTDGAYESRDPSLLKLGSGGILLFLAYYIRQDRPDLAEGFIEFLKEGTYVAPHPIVNRRSELYGKRKEIHRLKVLELLLGLWDTHKRYMDKRAKKDAHKDEEQEMLF